MSEEFEYEEEDLDEYSEFDDENSESYNYNYDENDYEYDDGGEEEDSYEMQLAIKIYEIDRLIKGINPLNLFTVHQIWKPQ